VVSPSLVFYTGAAFAFLSLAASQWIPRHPEAGRETVFPGSSLVAPAVNQ